MKTMRKLFSVLLAFVMVMGLSVTAFAAETTYSITIKDAVKGETYNAYKIFDASPAVDANGDVIYDTDGTIKSIAYTISANSQWLTVMQNYKQYADASDTTGYNPFTFTASAGDEKVLVVTLTTYEDAEGETQTYSVDSAALAAYLNTKLNAAGASYKPDGTATGTVGTDNKATAVIDVSNAGAGYYFVDTSLGALCSLDTVVGTQQEIYEKNSYPSITKKVKEDDNNSNHTALTSDYWKDSAVLDVIDTVHYQLTVNTGTDKYTDSATGVDSDYTIVDKLPQGIAYDSTAGVTVKVDTTTWTQSTAGEGATPNNDYTVSYNETSRELTIVLLASGSLADLAEDTDIIITYDAIMSTGTDGVAIGTANTNTVTLTYKSQKSEDTAVVYTYELVPSANTLKKTDGTDPLKGVTFVLSRKVGNDTQYAVVDTNGYLTEWTSYLKKSDNDPNNVVYATQLTTDDKGTFNVKGLDAGEYILTETSTLPGYNLLTDTITVAITAEGTVTYKYTSSGNASGTMEIVNTTGTELPSTGGIGTTIFYVVGTILVLGVAILLIVKKRMSGTQE